MGRIAGHRYEIHEGEKFGRLTVIKEIELNKSGKRQVLCRCECGNEKVVDLYTLRNGRSKCCGGPGCKTKALRPDEYIVKTYNDLTIIGDAGQDKNQIHLVLCKCVCGNTVIKPLHSVIKGHCKTCGDSSKTRLHPSFAGEIFVERTESGKIERLYNIWGNMRGRCYDPKDINYHYYGEKGVIVCDEWKHNFRAFKKWALENGYSDELTLDRIDFNGNYEPQNCRWATIIQQANNKRSNVYITYQGITHTMAEWARIVGVKYNSFSYQYGKHRYSGLYDFNPYDMSWTRKTESDNQAQENISA